MGMKNASKVDEWLTEEKLELLRCWARDFSLTDICAKMGISPKTFIDWRNQYPQIGNAVKEGKEIVDYRVENALLKVALGYTAIEVKTIISPPDKSGNRRIREERTVKEIPPNPTAIMCWLNNRKPDSWKRNRDVLQTEDKDNKIVVNIIKKGIGNDDNEEWSATANNKKGKSKKDDSIDLDYWPEDWRDDQ